MIDTKSLHITVAKLLQDAKRIGAIDSNGEMMFRDYLKMLESEIVKKEEVIQRTVGEVFSMKQQFVILSNLVRNHIAKEEEAKANAKDQKKRLSQANDEEAVKTKK